MKLVFTDGRGVTGTVSAEPWELDYDGFYDHHLTRAVNIYAQQGGSQPVEGDINEIADIHSRGPIPAEARLRNLRAYLEVKHFIMEMEIVDE